MFVLFNITLCKREELVEAVTSKGGPFMEGEQWSDMTALDHMTLETIPARFEVTNPTITVYLV